MSEFQPTVRLMRVLAKAAADFVLFPFRCAWFLLHKRRYQEEVLAAIRGQAPPMPSAPSPPPAPKEGTPRTIFLAVGDISAEPHALRLMREANVRRSNLRWVGFGGTRMEQAGCRILFNPVEMTLFGFSGPARQIPAHLRALRRFVHLLETEPPDALVLLDYPGFNLYLAQAARGRVPVTYYICPQLWAWAPWRLPGFGRNVGRALSILPFEAEYFRRRGVSAQFVGHPIADALAESDGARPPGPAAAKPILAILPGSRGEEIDRNLPAMLRVAAGLRERFPEVACVLSHERQDRFPQIRQILAASPIPVEVREGRLHETLREARLVFVKSGTAALESAHFEVPMIVFYKLEEGIRGRFSEWVKDRFLICPHFASVNLLAGREVVPEFAYSREETEERIVAAARGLWPDGPAREGCRHGIREARRGYDWHGTAARVAEILLEDLPP